MSAYKIKQVVRIIDLNTQQLNKSKIAKILRETKFQSIQHQESTIVVINNEINLGLYSIKLSFQHSKVDVKKERLREYGKFDIRIFYKNQEIKVLKDPMFKTQAWIREPICINELIEAINYCARLDRLNAYS